ncbi:MAG: ammonia-forming cytochrome c nitrite reductase subunit c552 [Bacteroidetes bacterium GWF2_38_335]|nr:MAG: ammonia-forming cytochrome c nitrite reductase subunit c552 [Bacteroidetes bacterium GWF2_38_335]OFY76969.1 MAG: ammonia-forming cytochrome c nitrite reductase subunit c552 [Bacteroidetes bacterium RIFOXYA12_FULL_38_20]HBS86824.1 ammonia-forming cytochrome c nitrite reductase [Bacteroidales bacterium]
MKSINEQVKRRPWLGWVLFFVTMIVVFFLGLLASTIMERRAEAVFAYTPQVELSEFEPRNEIWGENFPREFQSYYETADTTYGSKYNGNKMIDMLEIDPKLVVLWAGYGFSKDYNQSRGHYYAVTDVYNSLRTGAPGVDAEEPMVATCWTCKSPDVPRLMHELQQKMGSEEGIAEFYSGKWSKWGEEIINPIGCADCHDPVSMNLRITRPALIEAFKKRGKDVTKASHQEMRSLVCAQCHVEYYFDKKKYEGAAYLTFPWKDGMTCDDMEKYYDTIQFSDWTHALSRAPMLKAQHPDYEMFFTGVHADRGVACADCHMPYRTEGGVKYTNHKIMSPLNNVANSCQVCHREETDKLIKNVYERQDKIIQNRDKLEELLVRAHVEAKTAWDKGATEEQMKDILNDIRRAQWRWDFAAAGHGNSFHSPVETSRIIANGINFAQEARIKLARVLAKLGVEGEVPYPDITTKAKAQEFIGLDMKKLNEGKQTFIKNTVPKWLEKAKAREAKWGVKRL